VTITAVNLTICFISFFFDVSDHYFFNISSIFVINISSKFVINVSSKLRINISSIMLIVHVSLSCPSKYIVLQVFEDSFKS